MRAPAALPCALPPGPGRGRRGTEPPGCAERASRRGAAAQVAAGGAVFVRPFVGPGRAAQGRAEGPGRAGQPRGDGRAVRCGAVPGPLADGVGLRLCAPGCGAAPCGSAWLYVKAFALLFSFSSLRVLGFLPSSPPGIYLLFLSFLSGVWAALCAAWSCAPSFLWVPSEWGRSVMLSCAAALGSLRWWGVGWGRLQRSVLPPWLCDSVRFWDFKFFGFRVPLAGAVQRFTLKVLSMVLV